MKSQILKLGALLLTPVLICSGLTGCGAKEKENADLKYPSQNYSYEETDSLQYDSWCRYDDAYLTRLREDYSLDQLVADCGTEFEKVQEVTEWVSNLWSHNGDNVPEQSDPLFILDSVTNDGEQYRCVEYGVVISGCLNALGIPSRTIGLKTQDVETRDYAAGHVTCEAYLKDYEKWVFIDGQWGLIPIMGETPLNAVQLGEVLQHPENYEESLTFYSFLGANGDQKDYRDWILEYLYYFDVTGYTRTADGFEETYIMLTPLESESPTVFQIHYPLEIDIYTHSVPQFYPKVKNV